MEPLETNQVNDENIHSMNPDLLLLFTRFPEPGKVKTRLIPALGAAGAASLHRQLTNHILEILTPFIKAANSSLHIYFDGAHVQEMQQLFGIDCQYRLQSVGDLGRRMSSAFAVSLEQGGRRVVLIGSDCPGISEKVLNTAFSHLNHYDLVLGPATDGGYYLIGLTEPVPELFRDVPWGTAEVLAITLLRAARLGLRTILLEPLTDIDRPADLPVWEKIISTTHA
jgi:uncharacterized protein